ncbi:MAG: HAD-IIB family hydrolase [Gammaproteobacteria bacterium]|nr:HAD-IIB family hydrolase [Gammaproteobacteria bacterium]
MNKPLAENNEATKATRLLLCTDLDRTLIPNGPQPESDHAREYFKKLTAHPDIILAYVTGRHRQLVEQAIEEYDLPQADFVIADVGSSIYQLNSTGWQSMTDWEKKISDDWQQQTAAELHDSLLDISEIKLQEASKQNIHKFSYYVALNTDHQSVIKKINLRLQQQGIAANIIWSIDELINTGLLDILPASAGKRQAIEYLMKKLDYEYTETVFAGDSGNDVCVLSSPVQSVLVANADTEVRQQVLKAAQANNLQGQLYLAQGNFMDMNGNYSAGIVEGVIHYLPHFKDWLQGAA